MNNLYADGFGAEIFTTKTLESFADDDLTSSQKEHVTSYIWDNQKNFKVCAIKAPKYLAFPKFRFDINEEKDLKYINKIVSNGGRVIAVASYGKNIETAIKGSYSNIEKIRFDNQFYRKDIGKDMIKKS